MGWFDEWADPFHAVGNLFGGNASAGYDKAGSEMERLLGKAGENFNPYMDAGKNALPQFQEWMKQYKNPQEFMQNVFSNYNMSPMAMNQMGQSQRAANQAASASGLTGSTAHMREAGNIANQATQNDMQQYLKNILGIGGQYGQGLNSLMGMGMQGAQGMGSLYGNNANALGQLYGGGAAAGQNQMNQLLGMGMNLLPFLM